MGRHGQEKEGLKLSAKRIEQVKPNFLIQMLQRGGRVGRLTYNKRVLDKRGKSILTISVKLFCLWIWQEF